MTLGRFAKVLVRGVCLRVLRSGVSVSLLVELRPRTANGREEASFEMSPVAPEHVVVSNNDRIKALRRLAFEKGCRGDFELKPGSVLDGRLLKLAHLVNDDLDLAADALALWPRPGWLDQLMKL
jgi:hypothetical protein